MAASFLYPVALDVRGRPCVVVGAGTVGARRVAGLREAGASVTIVAPDVRDAGLRELIAAGSVDYREAMFQPSDLDGAFLAVAAADAASVNAAVAEAARSRGILLNLAAAGSDEGEAGDFATMTAVRRGDLVIGVTTGGAGPALAARVKWELDDQFGPEWGPYVSLLGEMRGEAKTRLTDDADRAAALRRLAGRDSIRERLASGDEAGARREAEACLSI